MKNIVIGFLCLIAGINFGMGIAEYGTLSDKQIRGMWAVTIVLLIGAWWVS